MAEEIEKIYVIPLKRRGFKSSRSAPTAVKRVKTYLTKHMKVKEENIWIDDSLNNAIWDKGKYNMASKIRVKAVKFEDGVVEVYLPELEFKKSRRELLKEEREKKEPILKKEEEPVEEGEVGGAEDYDISPTGDGDVRIKKKKVPKEKEEGKEKKPKKEPTEKKEEKPAKKAKPKKTEEKKPKKKTVTKTKKEKKPEKTKPKKTPATAEKKKSVKSKSTKIKAAPKKDKKE
ncbi:MAG: 50S ribosomal protein L31e [Candidatus Thermoplasmatota archaeon]|nr:50S ribosomal protein L31e [Candidatus Thermoplasmatota archaeon]